MNDKSQRVVACDLDIPFARMVVLSLKGAVAAIPALVLLLFLYSQVAIVLTRVLPGPPRMDLVTMPQPNEHGDRHDVQAAPADGPAGRR